MEFPKIIAENLPPDKTDWKQLMALDELHAPSRFISPDFSLLLMPLTIPLILQGIHEKGREPAAMTHVLSMAAKTETKLKMPILALRHAVTLEGGGLRFMAWEPKTGEPRLVRPYPGRILPAGVGFLAIAPTTGVAAA